MNRLTHRSIEMRKCIVVDVARAYAHNPAAAYTRQELQNLCPNIVLTSAWLQKLQNAGLLKCEGTRHAKYTFIKSPMTVLQNVDLAIKNMDKPSVHVVVSKRKATYDELLAIIKKQRVLIKQLQK